VVGETSLKIEMIRNGWAVSHHSGTEGWEMIARENKRGMWRGQFVMPKRWRQGHRLPGEAVPPVKNEKPAAAKATAILGAWDVTDRHVAIGSLYQPVHGVRKREAKVYFAMQGDRIIGHAVMADHAAISFQERWKDGRTEFRVVRFADNQLIFEFDIDQWRSDAGPLAVENKTQKNAGMVRVEATLTGDRLVGKWGMFLTNGTEVFRGEWEADRDRVATPPDVKKNMP
jgi:hypothetical protein